MIAREQALELLEMLVPRTEAGELEWEQSSKQAGTFFLGLGDGVVSVAATKQFFQLAFFDQSGNALGTFRFRGEHLDPGSERMKTLYLAARGAALGADEIFHSMLSALQSDDARELPVDDQQSTAVEGVESAMPFGHDEEEPYTIEELDDPRDDSPGVDAEE